MARTAILLGATGLVGGHCLDLLLEGDAYDRVVSLGRRPVAREHPRLGQHAIDFDRPDEWRELVRGDDLFCCLGTTIKNAGSQEAFRRVDFEYPLAAAHAAAANGVGQYLIVTALGADATSGVFYNRVKGEVEDALRGAGLPSLQIFRPSLLLGERAELRIGERVAEAVSRALPFVFSGPLRKYRPVEARDVARAMLAVAARRPAGANVFESNAIQEIAAGA